jgi:hypothetical protein
VCFLSSGAVFDRHVSKALRWNLRQFIHFGRRLPQRHDPRDPADRRQRVTAILDLLETERNSRNTDNNSGPNDS